MRFNKYANSYLQYNVIQKRVINRYLHSLKSRVVDLGCGSEGLCKYKKFDFYLGVDISDEMLKINSCNSLLCDFNKSSCFELIKKFDFEQIVSFSALQWAKDLELVFEHINRLNRDFLLAIFTSNTFKTFHSYLNIKSPIYSREYIIDKSKILNADYEILNYQLKFNSAIDLIRYIRFSGVNPYKQSSVSLLRKFIKEFPINYLEFEIVVIKSGR